MVFPLLRLFQWNAISTITVQHNREVWLVYNLESFTLEKVKHFRHKSVDCLACHPVTLLDWRGRDRFKHSRVHKVYQVTFSEFFAVVSLVFFFLCCLLSMAPWRSGNQWRGNYGASSRLVVPMDGSCNYQHVKSVVRWQRAELADSATPALTESCDRGTSRRSPVKYLLSQATVILCLAVTAL